MKVECIEFGLFIGEIAILHSRARNSINGTILRAKTGDDIVRMSVMVINDNIFGPQPHLEDKNRILRYAREDQRFFSLAQMRERVQGSEYGYWITVSSSSAFGALTRL